jgi:two-component system CheB/CheR fusion protein
MLGVARDVSEQKRAEDEIRLAVKRRDEFLAMLSHELRNPLAAIVNAAGLMREAGHDSEPRSKGVEVIERQSRQMTRLLEDLLEVSRITQNKIELRKQVVDARTVVNEALIAMREKFAKRKVALAVELAPEPVRVNADPARLQQVVVNLLDNALKYTQGEGRVVLALRNSDADALLSVKDNGVGIEPGVLANVFEPFVQGRATLHRTEGGMGVGLAVVRSLVRMHDGSITAPSEGADRGSEFIVRLPRTSEPTAAASPRPAVPWPAGRRVVVVEDNVDSCEMLEFCLRHAGYEVFTAVDGQRGLELICEVRPDLAIVDIGLPLMDGFELARRVRARDDLGSLYLVALTGYGQSSDHAIALDAGFDRHLVKPLDPDELSRLMRAGAPAAPASTS